MTWTLPAAAWLLALAIPLVLWHLHRRRRVRVVVPSLLAWEGAAAGSPPPRVRSGALRDLPGLLFELLALGALTAAAAGPVTGSEAPPVRPLVLVVDASASTGAADGRWDEMVDLARRTVAAAGPDTPVTLVAARGAPAVLARPEDGREAARVALERLRPALVGGGALGPAAEAGLASGARVVVITDGCDDDAPGLAGRAGLHLVSVGRPAVNAGVVDVAVERSRHAPTVLFLAVRSPDGSIEERAWVSGEAAPDFEGDRLAADEVPDGAAWSPLPGLRVAVRAPGGAVDPYLAAALEAAAPTALPGGGGVVGAGAEVPGLYDVVVALDGRPEPGRPTLVLGAGEGSAAAAPAVHAGDEAHPVLRGVDLAELIITRGRTLVPRPGDAVLLSGPDGALAVAGTRDGARVVILGFRPTESTLPLGPGWPMLVRNALDWLGGGEPEGPAALPAGAAVAMPWPRHAPDDLVVEVDGRVEFLEHRVTAGELRFDVPVPVAGEVAVVRARDLQSRRTRSWPVMLLDARESDLEPRVPRNADGWSLPAGPAPTVPPRPWAPELALLGLAALVAEALWWGRRHA